MGERRLADLTVFIAGAFAGERHHARAERFFGKVDKGEIELLTLTLTAVEAEALYLTGRVKASRGEWAAFIGDLLENPLVEKVPLNAAIFTEHLKLYRGYGGKHAYFDSFHAAAARVSGIRLVTTDGALLADPNIPTEDLGKY